MPKTAADAFYDGAFDILVNNVDRMFICSSEPTTYTEAATTYNLATVNLTSGDFTKAAGDVSGRKVTIAQQTGETVASNGTAGWVALGKTTGSVLYYRTTCTSQVLTAGNGLTVNAWKVEINAPT